MQIWNSLKSWGKSCIGLPIMDPDVTHFCFCGPRIDKNVTINHILLQIEK